MNKKIMTPHKKEDSDLVNKLKENLDRYMRSYGYDVNIGEDSTTYCIGRSQLVLIELTQTSLYFRANVNGYYSILTDFERAYHKARKKDK